MITTGETDRELEADVLYAAWSSDRNTPAPRPLRDWIADYPRFAHELVDWSAAAPVMRAAAPPADGDIRADYATAERLIAEMRANYESPIRDLLDTARSRGLSLGELAARMHLGAPIIAKLRQRLLVVSTLPEALFAGLAAHLQVTPQQVRDYLRLPATLSPGAVYMADAPPVAQPQEEWETAIRRCPGMSETDRAEWTAADRT